MSINIFIDRIHMNRFSSGDKDRIDIQNSNDPDHQYYAQHGGKVGVFQEDTSETPGSERDSYLYQVKLDSGEEIDLR